MMYGVVIKLSLLIAAKVSRREKTELNELNRVKPELNTLSTTTAISYPPFDTFFECITPYIKAL